MGQSNWLILKKKKKKELGKHLIWLTGRWIGRVNILITSNIEEHLSLCISNGTKKVWSCLALRNDQVEARIQRQHSFVILCHDILLCTWCCCQGNLTQHGAKMRRWVPFCCKHQIYFVGSTIHFRLNFIRNSSEGTIIAVHLLSFKLHCEWHCEVSCSMSFERKN